MLKLNDPKLFEIEQKVNTGKLLGSQRAFIFAPERFSCIAGGYGSGKTRAICLKGLILSSVFPQNQGMLACFHGTDLQDRVKPVFFEMCPPLWIEDYNKQANIVTLRNGSVIFFRHIHDATAKGSAKTRRVGANLGWFGVDQMEEIEIDHWNALISRLRNPAAKKHFGFGAINPNGHDWIYKMFFTQFRKWEDVPLIGGHRPFFQTMRSAANILGVAVNSEENRISNGGFIDDDYFNSLIAQYDAQWRDRYVYCSFDDFSGKIYKSYRAALDDPDYASVHNIQPFEIPHYWECVVGIDVGGNSPWAVVVSHIDEWGNVIISKGLVKPTVNTREIAAWIKMNTNWNSPRTMFVIDWENKLAMLELGDYGIHCRPAIKNVVPGLLRTGSHFAIRKGYPLPPWYMQSQPEERIAKFKNEGAPKIYIFNSFIECRQEHDEYVWNPNKPNEPLKTGTKRFDTCDAVRYIIMSRPQSSNHADMESHKAEIRRFMQIQNADPLSAKAWLDLDQRLKERLDRKAGRFTMCDAYNEEKDQIFDRRGKIEWEG